MITTITIIIIIIIIITMITIEKLWWKSSDIINFNFPYRIEKTPSQRLKTSSCPVWVKNARAKHPKILKTLSSPWKL